MHATKFYDHHLFYKIDHVGAKFYSLAEVIVASDNFKTLIGKGGFGHVYYGKLEDGQEVAIKVLDVKSTQGPSEFFNEVCKSSKHFWDVHNEISSTWLCKTKISTHLI